MNHNRQLMKNVIQTAERFTPPEPVQDGVVLVRGTDLKPQPICWLWQHWLARGKLHILAGAPGQGKTTIAIGVAATVSIGGRWPDGTRAEQGNVLIWSGEDDPADTLLPRLIAAGADKDRCYFVSGARVDGEVIPFDPARDMAALMAAAERIGNVRLLVVDPVVSAVAGDSHKNGEVRRALQPLVDFGATMGCAVLGITHFAKGGQGQDPMQRVVGSIAFSAVARVVLVAAKSKDDEGKPIRVFARAKSNIGPDEGGFRYAVEQVEALPGIEAALVAWGQAVEGSARDLLLEPEEDREAVPREAAADFLRQVLAEGPTPVTTVKDEANQAGHSWGTVRRAADALGVIKRKGGMAGGWYWSLARPLAKGGTAAPHPEDTNEDVPHDHAH